MGLSITVGELAESIACNEWEPETLSHIRTEYDALSGFLVDNGLSPHNEPEELPDWPYRGQIVGFPYSCIHYLRRASAYRRAGLALTPCLGSPVEDPVLANEYRRPALDSHLINHADNEGFYVPQDFPLVLVADSENVVRGDAVGSSYALLRELRELAPLLEIKLIDGQLDDETANQLAAEESHPFGNERMVWFTLFEAARQSIAQRSVITFG